jgi:hypothetical protein
MRGHPSQMAPVNPPPPPLLSLVVLWRPPSAASIAWLLGVDGGHLVESTGYLITYPFYMLVRVRASIK